MHIKLWAENGRKLMNNPIDNILSNIDLGAKEGKDKAKENDPIYKLDQINTDTEAAHVKADEVLLEWLRNNGHEDIADAYDRVEDRCGGFWYA